MDGPARMQPASSQKTSSWAASSSTALMMTGFHANACETSQRYLQVRMCSLTIECVLLFDDGFPCKRLRKTQRYLQVRMCSLAIDYSMYCLWYRVIWKMFLRRQCSLAIDYSKDYSKCLCDVREHIRQKRRYHRQCILSRIVREHLL